MKKLAALVLSLFLTTGMALADTPKDADPKPAKAANPAKPKPAPKLAKTAEKSDSAIAAEIEELRQALQSQQEQLQSLKEELAKRDRQIDEAREAAAAANARATEASTKAVEAVNSSAEVKTTAATLNTTVSDLKASNEVLKTTVATTVAKEQADQKKAEEAGPNSLRYKGITMTPMGFFAAESVFRQRAVSGDVNTPFTGIPFPGNALSKVSEFNASARQSRIAMLFEGKLDRAKLSGYYETDFLSAAVTSNNRQSNSYSLRQRQFWGQVALDNGFSVTGGQMWSLATETKLGLQVRTELPPMTTDSQYNVGFTWARQYGVRVVKDFGGKFAVGFAVEGPQATIGGRGFSTVTQANGTTQQNFFINAPGAGGGLLNAFDGTGYTVNKAPDVIFKVAADPGFGHYELFGILSTFRNRVYPCAIVSPQGNSSNASGTQQTVLVGPPLAGTTGTCTNTSATGTTATAGAFNDTRTGGGAGISGRWPLFHKKLDFGVKGVAGDGIGRYGSAQLADMTFRPDGTQALIRTAHGLATFEFHATPKLDIFAYYGGEYAWRAGYTGYMTDTITTSQILTTCTISATCPSGDQITTVTTHTTSNTKIGGYGNIAANNSGCSSELAPGGTSAPSAGSNCAGDTRFIYEGTLGFWHKIYQGPHGGFRWSIQYSYFSKNTWSGANSIQPKAVDNMVWTSFRYYLP